MSTSERSSSWNRRSVEREAGVLDQVESLAPGCGLIGATVSLVLEPVFHLLVEPSRQRLAVDDRNCLGDCYVLHLTCSLPMFHHRPDTRRRSEEHTSELQSLMRISYAVFCLNKKN